MKYFKNVLLVLLLISMSVEIVDAEEAAIRHPTTSNSAILPIPSPDAVRGDFYPFKIPDRNSLTNRSI